MPRIPSREEPYHTVAKCNRHWKTKREFVTKAANKASHVDGSHYMLVCVTPKGSIEVHASEHFYDDSSQAKLDGVINWDVLRKRVVTIQQRNDERWTEIERQEKRFGVDGGGEAEDDDGDDDDDTPAGDGDRSLESAGSSSLPATATSHGRTSVTPGLPGAPGAPAAPGQLVFSSKASPPRPIQTIVVTPESLVPEYLARFEHLGQSVCANVLKAWIKVVEPKKQTKYPYKDKKGNEGKPPPWWPTGMRHVEPDHLHKDERPRLLTNIIQQASLPRPEGAAAKAASTAPENRDVTISRLHFATAEVGSSIPPRQHHQLRQIYLIAKEVRKAAEDRLREQRAQGAKTSDQGDGWSEIAIDLYERTPYPFASPPMTKRSWDAGMDGAFESSRGVMEGKENSGVEHEPRPKRGKRVMSAPNVNEMHHPQALTPLASHQNVYAVHPYSMEQQHGHGPSYGWAGPPPMAVASSPSASASGTQSNPPPLSSQGAYYHMQYGPYHPGQSYPSSSPYPSQYPYPINYPNSQGYAASADTPTSSQPQQQTPTQAYSGYGYEQQAFVGDLAGLPAQG